MSGSLAGDRAKGKRVAAEQPGKKLRPFAQKLKLFGKKLQPFVQKLKLSGKKL